MLRRAGRWLGIPGLPLILLSCTPLESPRVRWAEGGAMAVQDLPSNDAVPVAWGSLVSVTPMPDRPASMLWFQDDSATVRVVGFSHREHRLWTRALVIRRR